MLPLIMAGIMAAQSLQQGQAARAQAKIDKVTMKSNVKIENMRREAENILSKTRGDLARFQQARSNKYKLQSGADSVESQQVNMLRLSDAAVRGSLESRIQAAEVGGALAANAGAAGIGGSSLDMLNATNRIRQERAEQLASDQTDDQLYDASRNIDQTREATILGLDDAVIMDDINYMKAQEQYIKEPSWIEIGMNAGMQFATSYASMGGFDQRGGKAPTWLPQWLGGSPKTGTTTQLK